ncbi:MAG: ABC transporter ATP-binding protein [Candidatus Acidiferrales bacterium]
MDSIIQINDLVYSYRRQQHRPALHGVTLELGAGEFVAIAGRAGSGKSTLCYALNGLIPHSFGGRMEGRVVICGLNTRTVSVPELARRVGFVLQNAESQLVGLTVEEDVTFGLENIGLPREEVARRVQAALRTVRLEENLDRSPWTLSGGQKQRLSIAAAIAFQPQVLVLDNPTAELDPIGKEEVMTALARLNSELGLTMVIVNQELEEVLPYASRLILMDAGHIVRMGSPAEVIDCTDDVRRAGVKLPEVAQVAYLLRSNGLWTDRLPLTVDDAAQKLQKLPLAEKRSRVSVLRQDVRGEPMIEMENVSFSYPGGKPVLREVALTVRRGEFVALMGPNGSGKTTLAKQMNGLLIPTAGRVLVRGVDTRALRVANLAKTVGYVFQNPDHQLFSRTTAEELAFGPRNLGWSKSEVRNAVRRGLDQIGGQSRGQEDPFFMGLAERKLVAIASVLTMRPEVLMLDEPATGADHQATLRIMSYLSQLHRQGLTIVIVTHDVSLAANYADRMVVLRSGMIVLDGTPREIFQRRDQLRSCSVMPPQVAALAQKLDRSSFICRVDEMVERFSGAQ